MHVGALAYSVAIVVGSTKVPWPACLAHCGALGDYIYLGICATAHHFVRVASLNVAAMPQLVLTEAFTQERWPAGMGIHSYCCCAVVMLLQGDGEEVLIASPKYDQRNFFFTPKPATASLTPAPLRGSTQRQRQQGKQLNFQAGGTPRPASPAATQVAAPAATAACASPHSVQRLMSGSGGEVAQLGLVPGASSAAARQGGTSRLAVAQGAAGPTAAAGGQGPEQQQLAGEDGCDDIPTTQPVAAAEDGRQGAQLAATPLAQRAQHQETPLATRPALLKSVLKSALKSGGARGGVGAVSSTASMARSVPTASEGVGGSPVAPGSGGSMAAEEVAGGRASQASQGSGGSKKVGGCIARWQGFLNGACR